MGGERERVVMVLSRALPSLYEIFNTKVNSACLFIMGERLSALFLHNLCGPRGMTMTALFDQNLPGLARVHHALVRHRRGGGPAVQIQLVFGRSVPAMDGRGTGALSPQQAQRGKKLSYPHYKCNRSSIAFVQTSPSDRRLWFLRQRHHRRRRGVRLRHAVLAELLLQPGDLQAQGGRAVRVRTML